MLMNYVVLNVPIHHYLIQEHFKHKMFTIISCCRGKCFTILDKD